MTVTGPSSAALLDALLELTREHGQAENKSEDELLVDHLHTAPFRRALEPDVLLVQGGRGVGKSHLFRLLAEEGERFAEDAGARRRHFVVGFGKSDRFDPPARVEARVALREADDVRLGCFWYGLLARELLRTRDDFVLGGAVGRCLSDRQARIAQWLPAVEAEVGEVIGALTALDERLRRAGQRMHIVYDDLDGIVPGYADLFAPIRALLALWHEHWRLWRAIRPKIFLRDDIFESRLLAFPDASKLFASHRVELVWSRADLYQMWAKRLANLRRPMREWMRQLGVKLEKDPRFGWVPARDESGFQRMVEALVGRYMGANARKGESYTWIPNHVQDARGHLTPRAFLLMFHYAAEAAGRRRDGRPLSPSDFQAALERTSPERIRELAEEDPWLDELPAVFAGKQVPIVRDELARLLDTARWPSDEASAPPTTDADGLIEHLVRRGLLEERTDGRLNVPDIYLYGLGMKRKGGIRRAP